MTDLMELLAKFIAVAVILSMHEFAHAFAAYKCGDPTAKWQGRMTMNPAKHFDPLGIIMFAIAGFGWAKPVPVNPSNFKHYRRGCFWTSIAGVLVNFLFAFLFYPIMQLLFGNAFSNGFTTYGHYFLFYLLIYLFSYSLNFCAFNLLPLYPLDGFRVVDAVNKKHGKVYCFLRDYGYRVLLILILLSYLSDFLLRRTGMIAFGYLDVLGVVMSYLTGFLKKPIVLFWGLFI